MGLNSTAYALPAHRTSSAILWFARPMQLLACKQNTRNATRSDDAAHQLGQ